MIKLINFIFKQYNIMPSWVGGLLLVHLEILALIGIYTFFGVMDNLWLNHPDWRIYFHHSFPLFLLCLFAPVEILALLYYKFFVHARQKYIQHQASTEERNPTFREIMAIKAGQEKIMKHLGIKTDDAKTEIKK